MISIESRRSEIDDSSLIHRAVEWRVTGCIQSRRETRTWMRATHNKYTRVPTVARWKMGYSKSAIQKLGTGKRQERHDRASFRFIQTGPRTIARGSAAQKVKKCGRGWTRLSWFFFFLMAASWPSDLFLEIKTIVYRKPGRHLYSLVIKSR